MFSSRIVTSIAIVIGAVLGAVAAVWVAARASPPSPDPERQRLVARGPGPSAATSETAPLHRWEPPRGPRVPASAPIAPVRPADALFEPLGSEQDRDRAEYDCGVGKGEACLRLSTTFERGAGVARDQAEAKRYQRLAIGMFVRQCETTGAYGCYALAQMHAAGRGMPASDVKAKALMDRARSLCRRRSDPLCPRMFPDHEAPSGR